MIMRGRKAVLDKTFPTLAEAIIARDAWLASENVAL
jgi:hypothetical protein